jgi:methylthioribulose-1-phosphate dehydratase
MSPDSATLEELLAAARFLDAKGWVPATSGNLSVRAEAGAWISPSGVDKGELTAQAMVRVDAAGRSTQGTPSAETLLHLLIYRRFPDALAVLHAHGPNGVVLSRLVPGDFELHGYELAKVLRGVPDHLTGVRIPVIDNDQDMPRLVPVVEAAIARCESRWAFMLRGHGLYVWGRSVAEARRHFEALEVLFGYQLMELR